MDEAPHLSSFAESEKEKKKLNLHVKKVLEVSYKFDIVQLK